MKNKTIIYLENVCDLKNISYITIKYRDLYDNVTLISNIPMYTIKETYKVEIPKGISCANIEVILYSKDNEIILSTVKISSKDKVVISRHNEKTYKKDKRDEKLSIIKNIGSLACIGMSIYKGISKLKK